MIDIIKKVSKGKNQNRVTLPKNWKSDYVILRPMEKNIWKSKERYYDK